MPTLGRWLPNHRGAQRGIAAVAEIVAESPLGPWSLDQAAARLVLICQDPRTDLAAYYRGQVRLIGLFARLAEPARIMFLAHELAHGAAAPALLNDLRLGPGPVLVMHRMREATAEAVATRVLWQLRVRGRTEPWSTSSNQPTATSRKRLRERSMGLGSWPSSVRRAWRSINGSGGRQSPQLRRSHPRAHCRSIDRAWRG